MNTIKELVETDLSTQLGSRTRSKVFGLEYSGACPWCGGTNRFHVWPDAEYIPGVGTLGRYHCMESGRSGCGRKGDGLNYLQEKRGLAFADACKELDIDPKKLIDYRRAQKGLPPSEKHVREREELKSLSEISETWRSQALALARWASSQLSGEALNYLLGRGIQSSTIKNYVLGYYPTYKWVNARLWGEKDRRMSIPRGIVIPWFDDGNEIICIRFRRLPDDESQEAREHYGVNERTGEINRYKTLYGSSSRYLYGGEMLFPGCYTALFEGELDALIARQEADESICVVATGSTGWARSAMSERRLAQSAQVLVAYNADVGGDKASAYWLDRLPNSRRWRPLWSDANDMQRDGINVGEWLSIGFTADSTPSASAEEEKFECSVCQINLDDPEMNAHIDAIGRALCEKHYSEHRAVELLAPVFG